MSTKRKQFGAALKAKLALEAIRGDKTVNEIAQIHNVHPHRIAQWKRDLIAQAQSCFENPKKSLQKPQEGHDPDRLFSEIGRLKMELDWLKKSQV